MTTDSKTADRLEQAKRHLRHRDLEAAISLFHAILAEEPDCVGAHEGLGAAHFARKELDKAAEHFTQITRLDPRNAAAYVNLGAIYNRQGDYRSAVDALRRGLQKARNCSQAYYNLGIAQKNLGQASLAMTAYREAVRLDPQMADAHLNLANLYVDMGNYSQALTHYRKALAIDPGFQKAQRGMAEAEARMQETRSSSSPFGRLVDAAAPRHEPAAGPLRQLSDAERRQDRQFLATVCERIESAAVECRDDLKRGLDPGLLALTRTVTSDPNKIQLQQVHERFQEALKETVAARRELRERMQQLRQHEERMNAD